MHSYRPQLTLLGWLGCLLTMVISATAGCNASAGAVGNEEEQAVAKIKDLGGILEFDSTLPGRPVVEVDLSEKKILDQDLACLTAFKQLRVLKLPDTHVTDVGLDYLKHLDNLQLLNVANTKIGDPGLASLEGLSNLRILNLTGTHISDTGLSSLAHLSQLEDLYLRRSQVTQKGIAELRHELPNTRIID